MHREISHVDEVFARRSNLSLYLLTGLLALLLGLDLWPWLAGLVTRSGVVLPTWSNEIDLRRLGIPFTLSYALIAAILGGSRSLLNALDRLFEGKLSADLAVAIACIAAILIREPLVAAEVVFIGLVGECLESITFERTQRAIRQLVEVFPRRCWLLHDGQEVRVLAKDLHVGDRVVVKPGARVPVDGVILDGRSAVDTSALTGEPLPVDKGPGDTVLAGSLNQFGALTIEARKVAEHTVVGRVIELTARALKDKAPMERTADRLASYFLPAVLALALLTFLVSLGYYASPLRSTAAERLGVWRTVLYPTLAVLVVSCPCALILATPATIIAALGRLAGTGALIKGGSALERLAGVQAFAFDKTGTLTEGRLQLGEVAGLGGDAPDEVLRVAATAEQRSEHVLARLILHEARARQLALDPVEEFQALPGAGIAVKTTGGTLLVGTRRLLEENGLSIPPEALAILDRLDSRGETALLVARAGTVLGVIGARDRIRPEAQAVLAELRALGIQDISLLTGDRAAAARSVAESLGITEVHAELLPAQKADLVAASGSQRTAFVGDGINDAPALARAHVGIAIGSGTEVAAEAGDIVCMGDPLRHLPLLLRLARETVRIIRQNIIVFAFGVNGVGILVTAWLWPLLAPSEDWYRQSPLAAVIYHQLGSLAVLLNAMRLLWFERPAAVVRWKKVRQASENVDNWLQRNLDLDEWLHWLSHQWQPVLGVAAVLLLLAYALSGLLQVQPDERAVVRRFGRVLDDDLGPGLHWRWPWPIEEVVRVQPERLHTVEIGFRSVPGQTAPPASLAWESAHGSDGRQRLPDEAVMLTGDGNLIEVQAAVRYTIRAPQVYLFEVRDPDTVLRGAAEAVLRETVAGRPFLDLLTTNRQSFQADVLARLESRLRDYGPDGLGIQLDGLSLQDLHPPQEVVTSYHDVTRAMEVRDKLVNEERAAALRTVRRGAGEALRITRAAEAAKNESIKQAEAEVATFLARQKARGELSWRQEAALLLEAFGNALAQHPPEEVYREYQQQRQEWITVQATLTDFRLFWNSIGRALTGRDKLIVDTDKLPGRRQLLLFDPETFRVPVPVLGPQRGEGH